MAPAVTVLLPVYNGQPYLTASIESILRQSFTDFELLIIDDGSTDGSDRVLAGLQDPRIRIIRHQVNQGLIATLNHGLAEARSELIARHDQDDLAFPDRLARQVNFMNSHPAIGVCGGGAYLMQDGQRKNKIHFPSSDLLIRWAMIFYNPIIHPSVMYRRSVINGVAGYSVSKEAHMTEDYDLWWKVQKVTALHNLPVPLLDLRKHETNMTNQSNHLPQSLLLSKKYLDELIEYDTPVHLVAWMRQIPIDTASHGGQTRLLLRTFRYFIKKNKLTWRDTLPLTKDIVLRIIKAMVADNRA